MAAFSNTFNKQTCTYCLEDIPGLRVNCVTCPDFTLCLQCFALGAEIGPHKNNHDYQFRDCGTLTVLSNSGWSAREELNLLEAVENYGFGNWEEIKNTFPGRSAEEVKTEFYNRFLNGSIGRVVWAEVESKRPELDDSDTFDNGPLGNEITSKLPPLDVTKEEANELGYVPLRQDFEKEYDNTAELLVSPLSINPVEDNELDIALKLAQVDMYINSLRERMRRKRVISDYQLVSKFFDSRKDKSQKKKLSREQKEFEDKFRCFAQFMTANEYNQLLSCLNREQQLKVRMTELINYRKNGLTSLEECAKFNQLKLGKSNTNKKSDSALSIEAFPSLDVFENGERKSDSIFIEKKYTCSIEPPPTSLLSIDDLLSHNLEERFDLLSSEENKLCCEKDLYPSQYLWLKAVLLACGSESLRFLPNVAASVNSYLVSNGLTASNYL